MYKKVDNGLDFVAREKEVYRVIADSGDQVEDGQNEEEGCETEIDAVHKLLCFRQQISANRVI